MLLSGLPTGTGSLGGQGDLVVHEPSTSGVSQGEFAVGSSVAFFDAGAGVEWVVAVPGQNELWFLEPTLRGTVGRAEAARVLRGDDGGGVALATWDGRCSGSPGLIVAGIVRVAWYETPLAPTGVDSEASAGWDLGETPSGHIETALSAQRDLDVDGCDDLVMGAPNGNFTREAAGAVYVTLGGEPASSDASTLPIQVVGDTEDELVGSSVAVADMDGDGTADLVVGAEARQGGPAGGTVRVFLGPVSGTYAPSDADHIVYGTRLFDRLGTAMVVVDDDGDAQDDLVVGAANAWGGGVVYLLRGADWIP